MSSFLLRVTTVFFVVLMLFRVEASFGADPDRIGEDVYLVNSGPMHWMGDGSALRYRLVAIVSEVDLSVEIHAIKYGEENCCATIINAEKISRGLPKNIYDVDKITWLAFDTVRFSVGGNLYQLKISKGNYDVREIAH